MSRLTRCFRTWDSVTDASPAEVAAAIRSGGLADQKTATIQRALRQIRQDFGSITLEDLKTWPTRRAMEYLTSIPGIGPKTDCLCPAVLSRPTRAAR